MNDGTVRLRLTPASPIHIGSHRQQLRGGTEFIRDGSRCYLVDEMKLEHRLLDDNRIKEFSDQAGQRGFTLGGFFKLQSMDTARRDAVLKAISSSSSACPANIERISFIRPFLRNAYARPYIPGSALKGALRTALLYCFLKEQKKNSAFWDRQMNRVIESLHDRIPLERKRKTLGGFLDGFLQDFDLYHDGNRIDPRPQRQQSDLFRAVEIPELLPLDRDCLEIRETRIISLTSRHAWKFSRQRSRPPERSETENPILIYPEVLMPQQVPSGIDLEVKINLELWDRFRARSPGADPKGFLELRAEQDRRGGPQGDRARTLVGGLLSCCAEFASDIYGKEGEWFSALSRGDADLSCVQGFYSSSRQSEPDLRIGWGSGMLAAGIFSLIENREIVREVARLFPQYRRGWTPYGTRPDQDDIFDLFPKTRRVTMERGSPSSPLGWAKLEVI